MTNATQTSAIFSKTKIGKFGTPRRDFQGDAAARLD
jgi:hypothetical protein